MSLTETYSRVRVGKNVSDKFHIYKETKAGNQINDRLTTKENKIFEAILQHGPQEKDS